MATDSNITRDDRWANVSEPMAVPDVSVSDVLDVELVDEGLYRVTFVTKQRSVHDRKTESVICLRVVMTGAALERSGLALLHGKQTAAIDADTFAEMPAQVN